MTIRKMREFVVSTEIEAINTKYYFVDVSTGIGRLHYNDVAAISVYHEIQFCYSLIMPL